MDEKDYDLIKKEILNDGVDEEETDGLTEHPFSVNNIDIVNVPIMVQQICSRMEYGEIIIPEYQRGYVWKPYQQSRLIESILLKIPLPTFYIDAKSDTEWIVIDGLQRITTIYRFCTNAFPLSDLEYLKDDLEGKYFRDFEKDENLKKYIRRFNETVLLIYLVKSGTPKEVALNIFGRINTLGSPLSQQELRHALYQGASTKLLAELAALPSFSKALTQQSLNRMQRMSDKELILRLLAVKVLGLKKYDGSISRFLGDTMAKINTYSQHEIDELKLFFNAAMEKAYIVFENLAFRKIYLDDQPNSYRRAINKSLFESIGLSIVNYSDSILNEKKFEIINKIRDRMLNDRAYDESLSYQTNTKSVIEYRLNTIQNIFEEVCK